MYSVYWLRVRLVISSPIQRTPASWEWSQEWRPSPANLLQSIRELSVPEQPSRSKKMGPVPWPKWEPVKASTSSRNKEVSIFMWPHYTSFISQTWSLYTYTFCLQFFQLTTYYQSFLLCKPIITDSTPGIVNADFYPAFGWVGPSNQPQCFISAVVNRGGGICKIKKKNQLLNTSLQHILTTEALHSVRLHVCDHTLQLNTSVHCNWWRIFQGSLIWHC